MARSDSKFRLNVKFRQDASTVARAHVLNELAQLGALGVRRLFPDESDAELASVYVVECKSETERDRLLNYLQQSGAIDYAEPEVVRRLIKGGGSRP